MDKAEGLLTVAGTSHARRGTADVPAATDLGYTGMLNSRGSKPSRRHREWSHSKRRNTWRQDQRRPGYTSSRAAHCTGRASLGRAARCCTAAGATTPGRGTCRGGCDGTAAESGRHCTRQAPSLSWCTRPESSTTPWCSSAIPGRPTGGMPATARTPRPPPPGGPAAMPLESLRPPGQLLTVEVGAPAAPADCGVVAAAASAAAASARGFPNELNCPAPGWLSSDDRALPPCTVELRLWLVQHELMLDRLDVIVCISLLSCSPSSGVSVTVVIYTPAPLSFGPPRAATNALQTCCHLQHLHLLCTPPYPPYSNLVSQDQPLQATGCTPAPEKVNSKPDAGTTPQLALPNAETRT